jgi:flagellar biosynthesis protein FliP
MTKTLKIKTMKNLLLLSFFFFFTSMYSQSKESAIKVNTFEIKSNTKQELQDFNWKKVRKFFKENDPQDDIKIIINYVEKSTNKENDNVLKTEIKGKAHELNKMIRTAKKITRKLLRGISA